MILDLSQVKSLRHCFWLFLVENNRFLSTAVIYMKISIYLPLDSYVQCVMVSASVVVLSCSCSPSIVWVMQCASLPTRFPLSPPAI